MKSRLLKLRRLCSPFLSALSRLSAYLRISIDPKVYRHLHFVGPFNLYLFDGIKLTLFSWGDSVENELAWSGWRGHEHLERLRWMQLMQLLKADACVLDLGANTGTFAFMAKAISPSTQVYAFEPLNRIAKRLQKNCRISGLNVEVINSAVSDSCGTQIFYDVDSPNVYSASLVSSFLGHYDMSYLVPVTTVDAFVTKNSAIPDLVKLDVEGAEALVLNGCSNILKLKKTIFLIEISSGRESIDEIFEILGTYGYCLCRLVDLSPVSREALVCMLDQKKSVNFIMAPIADVEALALRLLALVA